MYGTKPSAKTRGFGSEENALTVTILILRHNGQRSVFSYAKRGTGLFVLLFDVCPVCVVMCVAHGNVTLFFGINDADHTRPRSKESSLGMSQEVKS